MITAQQATEIVLENTITLGTEKVSLHSSIGRQLRESLIADRDFPPFDRVMMDGIALRYEDVIKGQRIFPVIGTQAAGSPALQANFAGNCIEIMTGAVLPKGVDTVIRYEDVEIQDGMAKLMIDTIREQQNVHHQGSDRKKGSTIVEAGGVISSAEIGVAATIGKTHLVVSKLPQIVLITTGDEIVPVEDTPLPHQIRTSNSYTIQSLLAKNGIKSDHIHIPDDKTATEQILANCLAAYDVVILNGGASKGKFDYVPPALESLGVKRLFYKVKQRPGKPFWFGKSEDGKIVFALPGNPVSAFMCTNRYFLPWYRASMKLAPHQYQYAVLAEDFTFSKDLQYFLQVKVSYEEDGKIYARPIEGRGSGDLANLVDADGFLELPQTQSEFKKGSIFPLIRYR